MIRLRRRRPSPPFFAGPVHGVRTWSVAWDDEGNAQLHGFRDFAWESGGRPTRARCRHPHRAPGHDCACGLYARHVDDLVWNETALLTSSLAPDSGRVAGVVAAWGHIELHLDGFRAEYARPVAFLASGVDPGGDRARGLARLAERYGSEVLIRERPNEVTEEVVRRWVGVDRAIFEELVFDEELAEGQRRRLVDGLARVGSALTAAGGAAAIGVLGLFYAAIVVAIGVTLWNVVFGEQEYGSGPLPLAEQVEIRDQGLAVSGRERLYWAIVRNASEDALVGVRMRGVLLGRDGGQIERLDRASRFEGAANIAPGQSALVYDEQRAPPGARTSAAAREALRYRVEAIGRDSIAVGEPPLAISRPRLDRDRCRLEATVRAPERLRRAAFLLAERDVDGELTALGDRRLSDVRAGSETRSLARIRPGPCRAGGLAIAAFPRPSVRMLEAASGDR